MKYLFLNPMNGQTREVSNPADITLPAIRVPEFVRQLGLLPDPWMVLKILADDGKIVWLANAAIG